MLKEVFVAVNWPKLSGQSPLVWETFGKPRNVVG